jgi:hypothetical protein
MPPIAFYIVIGFGSTMALFGFVLLLMVLTRNPRAKQTLIVGGREWRLGASASLVLLAGGLCMGLPFVYVPAVAPHEPSAAADSLGSHDHGRHISQEHDYQRSAFYEHHPVSVVTGGSVEINQPEPRQHGEPQVSPPDGPVNLTGEWTVMNTVLETSYQAYRDMRLGFRLVVHQDGPTFTGQGEKYLENGRKIPVAARSPIRIQGRVAEGSVIDVTFQEEGRSRRIQGRFRLTMHDRQRLTGTFVSTAAAARGASQWSRASARQGAPAPMREPPSRGGHVRPPLSDQSVPPVLTPADKPREPVPGDLRTTQQSRPSLQLGMSQAEVRHLLGEPVSVEDTPEFVFWNYGAEAYVVFDQGTGRVHGWLGVSS